MVVVVRNKPCTLETFVDFCRRTSLQSPCSRSDFLNHSVTQNQRRRALICGAQWTSENTLRGATGSPLGFCLESQKMKGGCGGEVLVMTEIHFEHARRVGARKWRLQRVASGRPEGVASKLLYKTNQARLLNNLIKKKRYMRILA